MGLAAIVLLGFVVRLIGLARLGDLEFDEIVSVRYAGLPVDQLLPRLAGALFEHPPAFYLALGAWRGAAGAGDAEARMFSVFPGTLAIPLAYAVGRRLFDRRTGTLAALLVAAAPLTIFYSREARMYGLVACLALASCWLLLRALAAPRGAAFWLVYVSVSAVATYVHYAGAMLLGAHLAAAVAVRHRAPHAARPVALSAGAIVALAAPWLIAASGARASLPSLSLAHWRAAPAAVASAWTELAAGPGAAGGLDGIAGMGALSWVAGLALLLLAAAGLSSLRSSSGRLDGGGELPTAHRRPPTTAVAVGATLLAGITGLLFAVALGKPVQARYLVSVAPLVYVCAAAGLRRAHLLAPGLAVLGGAALVTGAAPFWSAYYGGYARADYSAVTRHIAAFERPGDGVLLTGPWQAWYFDYYYTGRLAHDVLPRDAPPALDPAAAEAHLARLSAAHRRLWFVQAGLAQADPTNFVERWLRRNAWPAWREAHQNAVLSLYALAPPEARRPLLPVTYGGRVRLTGGWLDAAEVPSGDVARLVLELELLEPAPVDYRASLRLVGSDGQRAAADFDLVDHTAGGDTPTSAWPLGQRVALRRGVWLPPSLGPQPYDVRLVVYDPATLAPLEPDLPPGHATHGGEATIGSAYVTQALGLESADRDPSGAAGGRPSAVGPLPRFGGGDDFDAIDFAGAAWVQRDPSAGPLTLDLAWRLAGRSGTEHRSTTTVVDRAGRVWHEETRPLFGGAFAMHDWREGQTLRERRSLDLTTLPPGRYRVLIGLQDGRGRVLPLTGAPESRDTALEIATFDLPYRRPLRERLAARLAGLPAPRR